MRTGGRLAQVMRSVRATGGSTWRSSCRLIFSNATCKFSACLISSIAMIQGTSGLIIDHFNHLQEKISNDQILPSRLLFLALLAPLPPRNPHPPDPSTNPKAYQKPLLLGAKTVTSSRQIMATRSIGAMMPCQRPFQNPYVLPSRHSETSS